MAPRGEIDSDKILMKNVFKNWYRIPEYQRPYVWGFEEINDLLDDLSYAFNEKPDSDYFLGTFVYQSKPANPQDGKEYIENDLLDGQQRLTTLLLLFAVIRDLTEGDTQLSRDVRSRCQEYIHQKADLVEKIPERPRLFFSIREDVRDFFEKYVIEHGGTENEELIEIMKSSPHLSIKNMSYAILEIKKYFQNHDELNTDELLMFIANKVLMIYVSTEDLDDAFRLFTILNDRGVPLRNSDILKSLNLGELQTEAEKAKYAKLWEDAENEMGDDFDRFLNHLRTILVKERARLTLLREFEDKIYEPKEKDKITRQRKPVLLKKGKETFEFIERYLKHYNGIFGTQHNNQIGNFQFDNLIKVMSTGLPATDWVPPLMLYFDKFKYNHLLEFLIKLDIKFSADWIGQRTPTDRIDAMNSILKLIDTTKKFEDVFKSKSFEFDKSAFLDSINSTVYGRRFAKYLMLKLDYFYIDHALRMNFDTLSVEHILPQTPAEDSQWVKDFTFEQREELTHKLGNLVLITCRKNTSLGRLDYVEKKEKYFSGNINTCPNSSRVMSLYQKWTPTELRENHETVISIVKEHYGIE